VTRTVLCIDFLAPSCCAVESAQLTAEIKKMGGTLNK
jgi:hypothetical protein